MRSTNMKLDELEVQIYSQTYNKTLKCIASVIVSEIFFIFSSYLTPMRAIILARFCFQSLGTCDLEVQGQTFPKY